MATRNLLVELLVEELPPKALKKLGEAFAKVLADSLKAQGLAAQDATVTHFATPRRLAAHVAGVAQQAANKCVAQKLMPVSVGLDPSGAATPALLKRLQALGADASAVPGLRRAMDGKAEAFFYESVVTGATLAQGLQKAVEEAIAKLPIPKVMTYQLEADCALPGWSSVSFVRPAHGLVALHGADVVCIHALGLKSGNTTQGHRFEAKVSPVVIANADSYAATLAKDGAVIAGFAERRAEIARQLAAAALQLGGGVTAINDDALLDEVTGLVERPNVLVCAFEPQFLEVPQECLILTMKANQKYFPLLDAQGKLSNQFLVVSNISPADASAVIGGNERVVRPRLADAKFFFDQDRKKTLASRVEGLSKVVYHNKLGSQWERMQRVRAIARTIGAEIGGTSLGENAYAAATFAKADLLTDMVGEFPELQGVMGGYYSRHDGQLEEIAVAIEDHYKPRFAGDELPRNSVGLVVALADKLETLVGMFGIGSLPTGDRDPFALRRHALGVIRMLIERSLPLEVEKLLTGAFHVLTDATIQRGSFERQQDKELGTRKLAGGLAAQTPGFSPRVFDEATIANLSGFIYDRLSGSLRDQGYNAHEVDAVVSLRPQRVGDVPKRLAAVRAFAALPEAPALAAANKRIGNILKKAPGVDPHVSEILLQEPAEIALYSAMQEVAPKAKAQFEAGDYTASLQTLAALGAPVDAFFENVMVNAEAIDLRLNRQGLLQTLHNAMNQVADLSKLAA
ncbi:MAG: glycine--tRNA ligase subunit beta [Rhodoferax sp.]|nr:glycine--tRNA ligase subunit beta [Rhodoferax sp.]